MIVNDNLFLNSDIYNDRILVNCYTNHLGYYLNIHEHHIYNRRVHIGHENKNGKIGSSRRL